MAPRRNHDGDAVLLELIGDVCGLLDIEELRHGLLGALRRALPSDYVSINDIGPGPADVVVIMEPTAPAYLFERFQEHAHENPLLRRYLSTLDARAYRFSDVISHEDLHALVLYQEVYAPMGVEYQLAFELPAAPDRVLGVALSRCKSDYSDAERNLANRARPYLIQAYLNAIAHDALRVSRTREVAETLLVETSRAAGVTSREAQVLRLVALGRSNQHIAVELGISDRTVGKHLEHSFRKLGVRDRSSAAARMWELAVRDGTTFDAGPFEDVASLPMLHHSRAGLIEHRDGLVASAGFEHAGVAGDESDGERDERER